MAGRLGYRLSDLAIRTGLSTSTVHRLLATLEKRRFVQFDRYQSKWHVGAQSFAVGATFARRRNFVAQAMPYLRKLRDQTRETANLAVVDDGAIIVLTRIESREIMRSLTKLGGRVAMVRRASARQCSPPIPTRTSTPSSTARACRA
jgi:IclR family transcriptional regulator, acetate operon repressor